MEGHAKFLSLAGSSLSYLSSSLQPEQLLSRNYTDSYIWVLVGGEIKHEILKAGGQAGRAAVDTAQAVFSF